MFNRLIQPTETTPLLPSKNLSQQETQRYQIVIDANMLLSKRHGHYQLNAYIKKYIEQFKKRHATPNIKIFILVAKESDQCKYLDDLFFSNNCSNLGLMFGKTELSKDERLIATCKFIVYDLSSNGEIRIDWNSLQENYQIAQSKDTIILTCNAHLLALARTNDCTTVECFPAGTISQHHEFLTTFKNIPKQKSLTAFVDIDGTTIITVDGIKQINPLLLDFLKRIKHCFEVVNLHFLTCKHSPAEQLSQLRQMLEKIIAVARTLKSEPRCNKKTLQELRNLITNMQKLSDKINEETSTRHAKRFSDKEEADEEMFVEEHGVIPLVKKLEALITFPPLEKPSLKEIQSRLAALKALHARLEREFLRLSQNIKGPLSADKIIEHFKKELQLKTPVTFTYLGTREETAFKIEKIMPYNFIKLLEEKDKG